MNEELERVAIAIYKGEYETADYYLTSILEEKPVNPLALRYELLAKNHYKTFDDLVNTEHQLLVNNYSDYNLEADYRNYFGIGAQISILLSNILKQQSEIEANKNKEMKLEVQIAAFEQEVNRQLQKTILYTIITSIIFLVLLSITLFVREKDMNNIFCHVMIGFTVSALLAVLLGNVVKLMNLSNLLYKLNNIRVEETDIENIRIKETDELEFYYRTLDRIRADWIEADKELFGEVREMNMETKITNNDNFNPLIHIDFNQCDI